MVFLHFLEDELTLASQLCRMILNQWDKLNELDQYTTLWPDIKSILDTSIQDSKGKTV
jgi:hypothetical protein